MNETILTKLAEGGVAALCLAAVLCAVVVPVLRALFTQQRASNEVLRDSVKALQDAVAQFARFQDDEERTHATILSNQKDILHSLVQIAQSIAAIRER